VPAVGPDGERVEIEVHAQRVVASSAGSVRVPINDVTPWNTSPDVTQSLRVWIPYAANADLAPGRHRSAGELVVHGLRADEPFSATALHIDLTVLEHTPADLGEEVVSPPLTTPASSMYFLLRDGRIGPTARIWWGGAGPTPLRLPVYDEAGGAEAILVLDAWQQETCGGRSSRWELHAGRVAGECEHRAVLRVAAVGNEHLQRGRTYRTDPSSPLVIEGRRWHAPEAEKLIRTFAFDVAYTARGL